jgi:hypothetical protein
MLGDHSFNFVEPLAQVLRLVQVRLVGAHFEVVIVSVHD